MNNIVNDIKPIIFGQKLDILDVIKKYWGWENWGIEIKNDNHDDVEWLSKTLREK